MLGIKDSDILRNEKPQEEIITKDDIIEYRDKYLEKEKIYAQMTLGYRYHLGAGGV